MRREDFEHVICAAAEVADDEIVVIGSQAVLGQHPDAPATLLRSIEVDVFPRNAPERADAIDRAMGDGSPFHELYGYYAHGVGRETPIAPAGWEDRLVRVEVPASGRTGEAVTAWCMEIHDLILAKLAAGREHDLAFARTAIDAGLVDRTQLELGVDLMPSNVREEVRARVRALLPGPATPRATT